MQDSCAWPVAEWSCLQSIATEHLLLQAALEEGNVSVSHRPEVHTEPDHEVLVLVGLPGQPCLVPSVGCFCTGQLDKLPCTAGSGKSTWANRYAANHPEKDYALLSVDGILKQLKVRLAVPCFAPRRVHRHYQSRLHNSLTSCIPSSVPVHSVQHCLS